MYPSSCITINNLPNKLFIFSRKFSLNSIQYASSKKLSKEGAVFNKLLGSSNKRRRIYFENSTPVGKLNIGCIKGTKENSRRVDVLNKLFIRHISDLLASNSYGEELMDKGLEISRVAVTPNFQQVNVFWSVSQERHAVALETSLVQIGFNLRHDLTQLGVIGIVPRVVFVRDKSLAQAAKVDYLLSIADYGDDHVPLALGSTFNDNISTPTVDPQQTEQTDTLAEDDGSTSEEKMPEMRHDIFGLDHSKMLCKIMKSLNKSRALHRFNPNLVVESEGTRGQDEASSNVDTMTKLQRKEAMAKFILTRKIVEAKKRANKYGAHLRMPEFESAQEECEEEDQFDVEDYIEEDEGLDQQKSLS